MTAADAARVDHIEVALPRDAYPVLVGQWWLDDITAHVTVAETMRRALLVTQQPVVDAGHAAVVEGALTRAGIDVHTRVVPDGEEAKHVDVLAGLWRAAAAIPLSRVDLVVAVGGGVVGDLAGFAAATYNRGIAVLQVPTSLLAQVDAAIGGKTGINLAEGKNLVGAFHQPIGVACDVSTLATLPDRPFVEGFGEVVKYGLISDPRILEITEEHTDALLARDPELLLEVVRRSAAVKARVVAGDEREAGDRAHLNLGHTYGHAVESLTGYAQVLHGEAVAIGTVVALRLGARLGRTPPALVDRAERVLERLGLPTRGPRLDRAQVWESMARDKKAGPDGVRFVVLDDLARPTVITPDRADVDAILDVS